MKFSTINTYILKQRKNKIVRAYKYEQESKNILDLMSVAFPSDMTVLRNQASLLSMKDIALQHVLLQLWSFGYVAIDSIAIASQTLISEHISKGIKYYKSQLYSNLIQITAS